jgi:hypothetical protein
VQIGSQADMTNLIQCKYEHLEVTDEIKKGCLQLFESESQASKVEDTGKGIENDLTDMLEVGFAGMNIYNMTIKHVYTCDDSWNWALFWRYTSCSGMTNSLLK